MIIDPITRFESLGAIHLSDDELLSFLFGRGSVPGPQALATAHNLLNRHEPTGLAALSRKGMGELCCARGIGPARARALLALFELARRMHERPLPRGTLYDNPAAVFERFRARLGQSRQEHFVVLLLDSRLRKMAEVEVCRGGINGVFVEPRVVFGTAMREGASAVVLIHNHPSGDPQPSRADMELTERLLISGDMLGIEVIDHLIIGDGRYHSMAEEGDLPRMTGIHC